MKKAVKRKTYWAAFENGHVCDTPVGPAINTKAYLRELGFTDIRKVRITEIKGKR